MTDARAVLAGIPGFEAATVLGALSNGPTNASYRVERAGAHFVLRIDKPAAAELGLDRAAEHAALEALAAAGLAQAPVFFDAAAGVQLRPFITGRAWTPGDARRPGNLARLAQLLRELHALPPTGRRFDPLDAARRYAGQLGTPQAHRLLEAVAATFAGIPPAPRVLCHNDPVCGNILDAGAGLQLIDWEYVGLGDPFFDLAVVVEHHGVASRLAHGFLAAYLGDQPGQEERARLAQQRRFYHGLLALWRLRTGGPTAD